MFVYLLYKPNNPITKVRLSFDSWTVAESCYENAFHDREMLRNSILKKHWFSLALKIVSGQISSSNRKSEKRVDSIDKDLTSSDENENVNEALRL